MNDMKTERIIHAFSPVFDSESRILVLGTMPSPKSRELGFYYSHPRNRFWPVLAKLFGEEVPETPEEKADFCLRRKIALWDVLKECDIEGASDSSIKNAVPNDISVILKNADIKAVFTTGATAAKLYKKFSGQKAGTHLYKRKREYHLKQRRKICRQLFSFLCCQDRKNPR